MEHEFCFYIEKQEALEILICVVAISLALALAFIGPSVLLNLKVLVFMLAFFAVTVGSGFILHEMAHKLVAIYYGAYARFRMWQMGLLVMFLSALFLRVVFAAPGAVYIYSRTITRRQNGLISLAGPLTNLALFFIFMLLAIFAPVRFSPLLIFSGNIWLFGAYINALLAFFNMLPFFPLDGSKIMGWNVLVWIVVTGFAFFAWIFTGGLI
jgi:Zn-dependent protease